MRPHKSIRSPKSLLYFTLAMFTLFGCQLIDDAMQPGSNLSSDYDANETIYLDGGQPRTLDPALTHGGPDSALGHIFSGLVTLDPSLQVQPELAAGWDVSKDDLTYTFYLRRNAQYHNGRSVTAQDVVYSWERAAHPDTGSDTVGTYLGDIDGMAEMIAGEADHIRGLRIIDDYTLAVTLKEPVVYFLQKLAYPVAFVVDSENVNQSNWQYSPNGTGPFVLDTWRDDELMVLTRNEHYYLEPARVAQVVINLGPGLSLSRYEQGQIDLVGIGGPTLARAQDPNNPLSQQLQTAVSLCTSTLGLNTRLTPFDDVRVRQAFNYALDKELLIRTFSDGNALPATGSLPPGMPGYLADPNRGYPYNPEKAQQLLAEAGYADMSQFPTLTFTTSGYGDVGSFETAVITMWQENLGVTIEPNVVDPFQFYDELYAGNVGHIYQGGWCADYPDPQNFLDILYHTGSAQNIGGYSNPKIDAQLEAARIERDVNTRMAQYQAIEQQLVADAPVVFLSHSLQSVLVSPELQNYELTPFGVRQWHLWSVER